MLSVPLFPTPLTYALVKGLLVGVCTPIGVCMCKCMCICMRVSRHTNTQASGHVNMQACQRDGRSWSGGRQRETEGDRETGGGRERQRGRERHHFIRPVPNISSKRGPGRLGGVSWCLGIPVLGRIWMSSSSAATGCPQWGAFTARANLRVWVGCLS